MSDTSSIRLHCLGGAAPRQELQDGFHHFLALEEAARESIWEVLMPFLLQPLGPESGHLIGQFAGAYGVENGEHLMLAVRTCSALIRQAVSMDLDRVVFEQDLRHLAGGRDGYAILVGGYEHARPRVRQALAEATLTDHGKVLTGLDWRIDKIMSSSQSSKMGSDVIFLTMHYQDGRQPGRITLQVTPNVMRDLRDFCDRFQAP